MRRKQYFIVLVGNVEVREFVLGRIKRIQLELSKQYVQILNTRRFGSLYFSVLVLHKLVNIHFTGNTFCLMQDQSTLIEFWFQSEYNHNSEWFRTTRLTAHFIFSS